MTKTLLISDTSLVKAIISCKYEWPKSWSVKREHKDIWAFNLDDKLKYKICLLLVKTKFSSYLPTLFLV